MAARSLDPTNADTQMEILDTFHDFCKAERGDGDASGDKRIDWMKDYIKKLLGNKVTGLTGLALNDMIKTLTNDKVTAISKLEHQTVEYFEEEHSSIINANLETKETLTYDTILDAWKANPNEVTNSLWLSYRTNQDNSILEINKGKKYNPDSFTLEQKRIIGNFILNYFFGQTILSKAGATGIGSIESVRVTFDAKSGIPGKIFTELNQVKNVMFPQTIGDSATTSLNTLKGRSEYIFPDDGKKTKIESNVLTKSDYEISYVNTSFSSKNPFGFSLEVKDIAKKTTITAPFGSTQTEGPSVNYIIDILKLATTQATPNFKTLEKTKKTNILSLGKAIDSNAAFKTEFVRKVKASEDGLLPDIKRSGDHDATIATRKIRESLYEYFMFVTIDILCALKSRREKNPTIWHCVDRLMLYRFPLAPEAMAAARFQILLQKMKTASELLSKILLVKDASTLTSLDAQKVQFTQGKTGYFDVMKKTGSPSEIYAESIINILGRLRMYALEQQVDAAKAKLAEVLPAAQITQLKTTKTTLDSMIADIVAKKLTFEIPAQGDIVVTYKGKSVNISNILSTIETVSKDLLEVLQDALQFEDSIETLWDQTEKKIKKLLTIQKDVVQTVNIKGENKTIFVDQGFPAFEYYPDSFLQLYEKLINLHAAANPASWTGARKQTLAFEKALLEYESEVELFLEQFPDTMPFYTELSEILSLDKVVPVVNAAATANAKKQARGAAIRTYIYDPAGFTANLSALGTSYAIDVTNLTLDKAQGGGGQRGGGPNEVLQTYDLSYLLFEVASMASKFLESAYMEKYPHFTLWALYNQLVDDFITHYKDDLDYLNSSFRNLYRLTEFYIQKSAAPAEGVTFRTIANPFVLSNYDTKEKLQENLDKIKILLEARITGLPQPTLNEFFANLTTDEYLQGALSTYTDMLFKWEIGWREIQYNQGYDYTEALKDPTVPTSHDATERLISFLLSLEANGIPLYPFDDPKSIRSQEGIKTALLSVFRDKPEKRFLVLLFVFAALENIMNLQKTNVFVSTVGNKKTQYASPAEWKTNLWNYLSNSVSLFTGNLDTQFPIAIPEINMGGKRRRYAKKTHRKRRVEKRKTRKHR